MTMGKMSNFKRQLCKTTIGNWQNDNFQDDNGQNANGQNANGQNDNGQNDNRSKWLTKCQFET